MVFIRPKILRDGFADGHRDRREVQLHPRRTARQLAAQDRSPAAAALHARSRACRRFPPPLPRCESAAGHADEPGRLGARSRRRLAAARRRRRRRAAQAMNDVAAPEVIRPQRVGFAFAKRHGVLVRACTKASPSVCIGPAPRRWRSPKCAAISAFRSGSRRSKKTTSTRCCARPTKPATTPCRPPKASRNPPTSRTSRRTCPNRPTCSRAKTTRPSSGSSTPCSRRR